MRIANRNWRQLQLNMQITFTLMQLPLGVFAPGGGGGYAIWHDAGAFLHGFELVRLRCECVGPFPSAFSKKTPIVE